MKYFYHNRRSGTCFPERSCVVQSGLLSEIIDERSAFVCAGRRPDRNELRLGAHSLLGIGP